MKKCQWYQVEIAPKRANITQISHSSPTKTHLIKDDAEATIVQIEIESVTKEATKNSFPQD